MSEDAWLTVKHSASRTAQRLIALLGGSARCGEPRLLRTVLEAIINSRELGLCSYVYRHLKVSVAILGVCGCFKLNWSLPVAEEPRSPSPCNRFERDVVVYLAVARQA